MLCEKCGKPTEGEQTLCPECAAEQAEIAYNEAPVQTEEPVQPAEVAEAPAPVDDTFELNTSEPAPKKKKKKGLIALIVAAVVVAGLALLAVFNWGTITSFFNRTFMEPQEYLVHVEHQAIAQHTAVLTESYGKWLKNASNTSTGTTPFAGKATINLTVSEDVLSLAEMALQQQGNQMELDWLSNVNLTVDSNIQDDAIQTILGLGLGEQEIVSLDTILDFEDGFTYIAIPELSSKYLSVEYPDEVKEELQGILASDISSSQELVKNLPSEEELNKMINAYVDLVLSRIQNVEKTTETVKIGNTSQKMVILSAKITETDLLNIADAILKEAEGDKTLEKFMDAMSAYINASYSALPDYEPVDLHAEFLASIPESQEELGYAKEEADEGNYLILNTYVDMQDNVRGHKLIVYTEGEKQEQDIYWLTAQKEDTIYTDAKLGLLVITGEKTEKNGTASGKFILSEKVESGVTEVGVTIEFANVTDSTGTYRLIPGESFMEGFMEGMQLPTSLLSGNVALELVCGTQERPNDVALNVLMGDNTLLSLSISAQTVESSEITIPSKALDANSQLDSMLWLRSVDFDGILESLEDANVPDEIIEALESAIAQLEQNMMG